MYLGRTRLETGRIKILLANSGNGGSGRGSISAEGKILLANSGNGSSGGGALVLREQSLRQAGLDIADHLHTWVAIVGQGNCWYGKGEEPG